VSWLVELCWHVSTTEIDCSNLRRVAGAVAAHSKAADVVMRGRRTVRVALHNGCEDHPSDVVLLGRCRVEKPCCCDGLR
jgi:hypothetical protein